MDHKEALKGLMAWAQARLDAMPAAPQLTASDVATAEPQVPDAPEPIQIPPPEPPPEIPIPEADDGEASADTESPDAAHPAESPAPPPPVSEDPEPPGVDAVEASGAGQIQALQEQVAELTQFVTDFVTEFLAMEQSAAQHLQNYELDEDETEDGQAVVSDDVLEHARDMPIEKELEIEIIGGEGNVFPAKITAAADDNYTVIELDPSDWSTTIGASITAVYATVDALATSPPLYAVDDIVYVTERDGVYSICEQWGIECYDAVDVGGGGAGVVEGRAIQLRADDGVMMTSEDSNNIVVIEARVDGTNIYINPSDEIGAKWG